jgi:hypothetical protein
MTNVPEYSTARKRAPAANRLPSPDPLLMAYATNRLVRQYGVSVSMAALVAELINTSLGDRR